MSFVNTIPHEIIATILQACNTFKDVVSLSSTCKRFRSIWTSDLSKDIIWAVGCRLNPALDVAMLAVRATHLVEKAAKRGMIAPVMTILSLTGITCKPNVDELQKVLEMQDLVRFIKHIYLLPKNSKESFDSENMNNTSRGVRNWDANFDLAVYRLLFAGAFVAHAYQGPFFHTSGSLNQEFLKVFYEEIEEARPTGEQTQTPHGDIFREEEVNHIRTFPVYELESFGNMEAAFGPFWERFIDDCQSRWCFNRQGSDNNDAMASDEDDLSTKNVWLMPEIARIMCIHAQLCAYESDIFFANRDGLYGHCRPAEDLSARKIAEKTHPVPIVLFGNFCVEEVLIPDSRNNSEFDVLIVNQVTSKIQLPDLSILFAYFQAYSGVPNHRDDEENFAYNPSPRMPVQFFEFALWKHLFLRFTNDAFLWKPESNHQRYKAFREEGGVFHDGCPDPTILRAEYPLPFLMFEPAW